VLFAVITFIREPEPQVQTLEERTHPTLSAVLPLRPEAYRTVPATALAGPWAAVPDFAVVVDIVVADTVVRVVEVLVEIVEVVLVVAVEVVGVEDVVVETGTIEPLRVYWPALP